MQVPVQLGDDDPGQDDAGDSPPGVAAEELMSFLSEFRAAERAQAEAARQAAIKARRPSARASAATEPDPSTEPVDTAAEHSEPVARSFDDLPWTTAAPVAEAPAATAELPERRRFGWKRARPGD